MAKVTFVFEDEEEAGRITFTTISDPLVDESKGVEGLTAAQHAALLAAIFVQREVFNEPPQVEPNQVEEAPKGE